jgi:hypothetical protein
MILRPVNSPLEIIIDKEDYGKCKELNWFINSEQIFANKDMKTISLSRFLLNYDGPLQVDHIDNNYLNNQKSNLRIVTRNQNCMNRRKQANTTSKYKGVAWNGSKWTSYITVNRKRIYLGYYKLEKTAAKKYNEAALKYFGEFAHINKIEEGEK